MDLNVDEFIEGLFSKEAQDTPSDSVKPEELTLDYPKWFDAKQFNKGRRFFWNHSFSLASSMLLGLIAVFAVPSILKILISTRRSNSSFTAYKRYLSTLLHTVSWFENDLKPGSISWKSLSTVRSRHLRAGLSSKVKGLGVVSQRDIALTLFGFIGFSMLKPDNLGVRQLEPGDWEAYVHFWRTIGHMIGLQDRYNICRKTHHETRYVCKVIQDRVFTPCLENPPEYFEHMARVMLDGMWCTNPVLDLEATLFACKHMADVPGYVYMEEERIQIQDKLRELLKGKDPNTGVDSTLLMCKPAVDGLPDGPPRLLYLKDYDTIESTPAYKRIYSSGRRKMALALIGCAFYTTYIGRWYFNLNYLVSLFFMRYFPYLAFFRWGIMKSFVNIFAEDPMDDAVPKPNSEYTKPPPPEPWYKEWFGLFW